MHKNISVPELQERIDSVLDEVTLDGTSFVLARDGEPEAALISYEEFLRLEKIRREDAFATFDRLRERMAARNVAYSDEEIAADVEAARAEVWEGKHGVDSCL